MVNFNCFRGFKKTGIFPLNRKIFDNIWKKEEEDAKKLQNNGECDDERYGSDSNSDSDYETTSDTISSSDRTTSTPSTTSTSTSMSTNTTLTNAIDVQLAEPNLNVTPLNEEIAQNPIEPISSWPTEPISFSPTEPILSSPTEPISSLPIEPILSSPTEPILSSPTLTEPLPSCSTAPVPRSSLKRAAFKEAVYSFKPPPLAMSTPKTSTRKRGISQELTSSPFKNALIQKRLLEDEKKQQKKEQAEKIDEAVKKVKL